MSPEEAPRYRRRVPLEEVELFRGLTPEQKREIELSANRRIIRKGAYLFHAGDASQGLHVLLAGRLKSSRSVPGGPELMMHYVEAGEVFAELPALLNKPYPSSAQALEECQVLTLPVHAIERLMSRQPEVGMRLLRSIARKLATLMERLQVLDGSRAEQRVARYLLARVREGGSQPPVIQLTVTKKVWAHELSLQPESLSRSLRKLIDMRLIRVSGRQITINNIPGLADVVAGKSV